MIKLRSSLPSPRRFELLALLIGTALLGLSCGSNEPDKVLSPSSPRERSEALDLNVDTACGFPIFGLGRPISLSDLGASGRMGFEMREVHFRDVVAPDSKNVELAYRLELRMELAANRFLEPIHSIACSEQNHPSSASKKLSRTLIPVLGDLHLPSMRVTVYDDPNDLANGSRISEMTVSNGGYFSFAQNWKKYAQIRTVSQYLNLLKTRYLYNRVEIRDMSDGWIGIYAERSDRTEKAQLLILLARVK